MVLFLNSEKSKMEENVYETMLESWLILKKSNTYIARPKGCAINDLLASHWYNRVDQILT